MRRIMDTNQFKRNAGYLKMTMFSTQGVPTCNFLGRWFWAISDDEVIWVMFLKSHPALRDWSHVAPTLSRNQPGIFRRITIMWTPWSLDLSALAALAIPFWNQKSSNWMGNFPATSDYHGVIWLSQSPIASIQIPIHPTISPSKHDFSMMIPSGYVKIAIKNCSL